MTIIKASTRASISRGIFSFVTGHLLPVVVRLHLRSLYAIQAQQDRDLKDARLKAISARRAFLDARDAADDAAAARVHVLIGLAEERQRINAYIKEADRG